MEKGLTGERRGMNPSFLWKRNESHLRQKRDESSLEAIELLVSPGKIRGMNLSCSVKRDESPPLEYEEG